MNKQEFIDRLRAALNGRIPAPQVEETVSYYRDYINVEMRKGRSEEEVLKSLGDPRLIARTIIQTNGGAENGYSAQSAEYTDSHYQNARYHNTQNQHSQYYESGYQDSYDDRYKHRSFHIQGWLLAVIIIVVFFLVFSLIFSVLSFLAPVIIVMAAVIFMIKLFRDWLN